MSKFNLFREMNEAEGVTETANIANFIENSLSSTEIYHIRRKDRKKAVLTRDHKEGNIEIILFTYPLPRSEKVKVGDYIVHKRKNFLTFQEYDHPLSKHYHKFKVLECNVKIKVDDLELPAAYFSSMRRFADTVSTKSQGADNIFENMKPVVVVKDDPALKVNFRFLAAGEAYRVVNIDRISNKGIAYLSVDQVPLDRMTDNIEESKVVTYNPVDLEATETPKYKKGEIVTLEINNGFVLFNPKVEVITRSRDEITFRVPYDIDKLVVTTRNENHEEIITEKEVI